MGKFDEKNAEKKMVAFRADTAIIEKFDAFLQVVRDKSGEKVPKEDVFEFFMDYCVELKPKEFLQLYYAFKAKKFSLSS